MQRITDGLLFLWQWLIFFPLVVLITIIGGTIAIPAARLGYGRWANREVGTRWARAIGRCGLMRITVEGREHVDPERSYIVVSNHQSHFDVPVVYGWSGVEMRWVMKQELRKLPIIGVGCEALGFIYIDRSNPDIAHASINKALADIPAGSGVMFFPEGTRSRNGRLQPFKKGAFRAAVEQQLPVLPMTIVGAREMLPPGTRRLRPGRVRLVIHPPIETKGIGLENVSALRDRCRRVIAGALETGTHVARISPNSPAEEEGTNRLR